MTILELKKLGALYVEHILDGMETYPYENVTYSEQEAYDVLLHQMEQYGADHSYTDFYYFALEPVARMRVDALLTEDEKQYVESIRSKSKEEIIFPLTKELLRIVVRLNNCEMLFSTIYFLPKDEHAGLSATTWWGNYQSEYVVFHAEK